MNGEISYDLIMEDEMDFVEGTFRFQGEDWKVFVFIRDRTMAGVTWKEAKWSSGVAGIVFRVGPIERLNSQIVEVLLSEATGITSWQRVHGPDSMELR